MDENKKSIEVSELQLKVIKLIAENQYNLTIESGYDENGIIFEYNGTKIVNPFIDESGCHEVNPVEYYGNAFLESEWLEYVKDIK